MCPDMADIQIVPLTSPEMQGWYDPLTGEIIFNDHQTYYQYNITDIPDPFIQQEGQIYWLELCADVEDPENTHWGWKSSENHWEDDAVWRYGEPWRDLFEPFDPIADQFWAEVWPWEVLGGGSGWQGGYWFYYPDSGWWNQWFYDHPFDPERDKIVTIEFDLIPMMPGPIEIALNYSTDLWSAVSFEPPLPPLIPPGMEDEFIARVTLLEGDTIELEGHHRFNYVIRDYNPEWVSIDVRSFGGGAMIDAGQIVHDCVESLDLAFVITGEECQPDFVVAAPGTWTGDTCGAGDDCDLRPSEDHIYEVAIPNDGRWVFSLCGSTFDTYLYVGTTCCGNEVCENDDACDYQSEVVVDVGAGTYYVTVEGYSATSCGPYTLHVFQCDLECQEGGIPEGEPVCSDGYIDNYNGGCNSSPPVFQSINCGDVVCGTAGTFISATGLQSRDTDWYELVLDEPMTVTWKAIAEFPVLLHIIDAASGDCSDYFSLGSATAGACEPVSVTQYCLPPGTYWLWIGTSTFACVPCGVEYIAQVSCTPCESSSELGHFSAWIGNDGQLVPGHNNDGWAGPDGDQQWFLYPEWWNEWWPNEWNPERPKKIRLAFDLMTWNDGWVEVAVNWPVPWWDNPERPPLPAEDQFVLRRPLDVFVEDGHYVVNLWLFWCPPWVSVDVWGERFWIEGSIYHHCSQWALGDLNCDGLVNAFDIDPFVLALTDPAGYAAAFPGCDRMLADCNGDGLVNAFDIDPFVLILTGG